MKNPHLVMYFISQPRDIPTKCCFLFHVYRIFDEHWRNYFCLPKFLISQYFYSQFTQFISKSPIIWPFLIQWFEEFFHLSKCPYTINRMLYTESLFLY